MRHLEDERRCVRLGRARQRLGLSVSFAIANELLDAGQNAGISEDELVAVVLTLAVVFTALPRTVHAGIQQFAGKPKGDERSSGLWDFLQLLVGIAKRISISVSVQLLAANVRAKQPLRAVRVVSLLSVAIFFLFLEATSSIGATRRT